MRILVTAGNTQTPIDAVRCLTNVFTGRTGGRIAGHAYDRGHAVVLLTSHPDAVPEPRPSPGPRWDIRPYRTFADLDRLMTEAVTGGGFDAVIHSAAVSDYHSAGIFAAAPGSAFDPSAMRWAGDGPHVADAAAGKVKSSHAELWLRLTPAPKLVDKVRREWAFAGVLVKFKLEVGIGDDELLAVAERSRVHSAADLMCANTLEGAADYAYLGAGAGGYARVTRGELPGRLMDAVERLIDGRPPADYHDGNESPGGTP